MAQLLTGYSKNLSPTPPPYFFDHVYSRNTDFLKKGQPLTSSHWYILINKHMINVLKCVITCASMCVKSISNGCEYLYVIPFIILNFSSGEDLNQVTVFVTDNKIR